MSEYQDRPPEGDGHGRVPRGVWAFFIAMLVWGGFYLVRYWDFQPPTPGEPPEPPQVEEPAPKVDTAAQLARIREKVPPEDRVKTNPLPVTDPLLELGQSIYAENCVPCHGLQGDADTPAARAMTPPPVNFTHPAFAELEKGVTYYITANGSEGTGMPPWSNTLSDKELWAVTEYLRRTFAGVDETDEAEGAGAAQKEEAL